MNQRYRHVGPRRSAGLLFALLLPRLASAAASQLPALHAAQLHIADPSVPTIKWDGSMIVSGQNNAAGPVGEHALVHGANFTDGQYNLVLAPGDLNSSDPATVCAPNKQIPLDVAATASGGAFDAHFDWPAAANQASGNYSICALDGQGNHVVLHLDPGPFTVLAANAPHIPLSAASVPPGGSITVTGQNWVPEQEVQVFAAPSNAPNAPVASAAAQSSGHTAGTFSVT